jgi:hypothetical protein
MWENMLIFSLCDETGTGKTKNLSECVSGNNERLTWILAWNKTTESSEIVSITDGLELLKNIIQIGK